VGAHRDLARAAMLARQELATTDFVAAAKISMPLVIVDGALGSMMRETVLATEVHRLVDVCLQFTIGDYPDGQECSSYYDRDTPWYNVFYGSYGLRSYKPDGSAWGYDSQGTPNFDELLQIAGIDYNFFTAGQFGCPPAKMCFAAKVVQNGRKGTWDCADVEASVPSGLHDPRVSLASPDTYVLYGVPGTDLVAKGPAYEPVSMRGRFYMRQMQSPPPSITLAWGGLCPDTAPGQNLLNTIIAAMEKQYLSL
jgi:hypothetical protein